MINLEHVKYRYEAARGCLGLSAPERSFDYMVNFVGKRGMSIEQQKDGIVKVISFEDDRNSSIVEFETSSESDLIEFLVDKLVRSCAVRDIMNDSQYSKMASGQYLEKFEYIRLKYIEKLQGLR